MTGPITPELTKDGAECRVSIGIFAWNEERALPATLNSLFHQSLFDELSRRNQQCEVICVTNGCTDRTPLVAAEVLELQRRYHPYAEAFRGRVAALPERGKVQAWNQFVHSLSARSAQFLFMMDADILIHRPDTLWNMLQALAEDPQANVTVDRPRKHTHFKAHKSLRDHLSLSASRTTQAAPAQLCGQLYCIRATVARNIYLPKGLAACEDGFIKALVCTDFLAHEVWPGRLRVVERAEHTFEAYTSPSVLLKNQKRQIIGQTIVHILVDDYLKRLPASERTGLSENLRAKDTADPLWLKRLIKEHLDRTRFCWQLYPGLVSNCFDRLRRLGVLARLACLPASVAASFLALLASFLAYGSLKRGATDYWPRVERHSSSFAGGTKPAKSLAHSRGPRLRMPLPGDS